jgi:hypothetical protein
VKSRTANKKLADWPPSPGVAVHVFEYDSVYCIAARIDEAFMGQCNESSQNRNQARCLKIQTQRYSFRFVHCWSSVKSAPYRPDMEVGKNGFHEHGQAVRSTHHETKSTNPHRQ